ncbi:DNA repair protein RadC [Psychromonas sp. CNPT3]|uniref:RadC family protein n=1 Tax=Psychromonas sp. CNPT3 TaxID=314282 RepID=UPI00006E56AA|nr:DNA repair protein RadC [Psychromonas sp. CNPT3]AGH81541.1 DNA repair protein RadC [Psychromonas sp. CNPT3]
MHPTPIKHYVTPPMTEHQILEKASEIIASKFIDGIAFTDVKTTKEYLTFKLAHHKREVFAVMFLNSRHQLIEYKEIFHGTIDSAHIYPREMLKAVLKLNASTVILAHNHPSGSSVPSDADIAITQRLTKALELIDVRVLDHVIVGETATSFAEKGLL